MLTYTKRRLPMRMILTGVLLFGAFALFAMTAFADEVTYEDPSHGVTLTGTVAAGENTVTITKCESNWSYYEVHIPDSINGMPVCAIEPGVFSGKTITKVTLPDGVKSLPLGSFYQCSYLTSIDLNQVTDMGELVTGWQTLGDTIALKTIQVADDNPALTVQDGVLFNKDRTVLMVYPSARLGSSYVIPDSVTQIWNQAFNKVSALEEVTLSKGVTEYADSFFDCPELKQLNLNMLAGINGCNFTYCTALERVTVSDQNEKLLTKDGVLFTKDMSSLLFYPPAHPGDSYRIPDGVVKIGEFAFSGCKLKQLRMPATLKTVGAWSLSESKHLRDIVFPEGLEKIETNACTECESLAAVYVPDSVTTITYGSLDGPLAGPYAVLYGNTFDSNGTETPVHKYATAHADEYTFVDIKDKKMPCSIELDGSDTITMDADTPTVKLKAFSVADLSYQINPEGIVSIDDEGLLTAKAVGTAVVTITAADAFHETATKTVTVDVTAIAKPTQQAESKPQAKPAKQSIKGAEKFTKNYGCSMFWIGQTAKTALTYKSSNPKVATVTAKGKIKILRPGKAKIYVKAAASAEWLSASKTVTISAKVKKPDLSAKRKGKKVKLSWTKVPKAKGYQLYIKYPGSKKYVRALTESYKVKSVTHRGLKKGRTYRYKMRAFVKIGDKKYYSAFSKVRKIKIK